MKNKHRLLPHEWIFGGYLAVMWLRLVLATGFGGRDALIYLAFIVADVVLIARCVRRESPLNWRLRLLFHPIAMNVFFMLSRTAVPAIHPQSEDNFLQAIDGMLIGRNLSLRLEPIVHPVLTEIFSLCYILFFPNLFLGMIYYFVGDLETLKRFFTGLFSLYGFGLLGYSLLPALGPWLAMADQFRVPLEGWWITRWNARMVSIGTTHVDVFPSLHCAVSSFILFFDRRHKPWRFRLYLVPCVGLWCSTIYLRYHYLIDVLCGFALAAFCLWLVKRFANDGSQHELPAEI